MESVAFTSQMQSFKLLRRGVVTLIQINNMLLLTASSAYRTYNTVFRPVCSHLSLRHLFTFSSSHCVIYSRHVLLNY